MGIVHVDIVISNPADPDRGEHLELLVDTGATLSVVPGRVLERLSISRIGRRDFRGFGGVISRETGIVSKTYDGATAGVTVVFGEQDNPPILGVTALESLGFQVDPVSGELKPSEMLLL